MSGACYAESFFFALLEVATTTTVDVHFNTTGHNVHALGVNYLCTNNG
jgi:hypothetical protein